jgi:hypothetical protein
MNIFPNVYAAHEFELNRVDAAIAFEYIEKRQRNIGANNSGAAMFRRKNFYERVFL